MPRKRRSKRAIPSDSFAAVIRAFTASEKFRALSAAAQYQYARAFRHAEHPDILGALSIEEIRPALVQAFIDGYGERRSSAAGALTALKSLERWAIARDRLPRQITYGVDAEYEIGGNEPWTDAQVTLAETHARPDLARMVTLAANTGQRASDLVRMRWSDIETYRGIPGINVTTQKTGRVLWIPLTGEMLNAMQSWDRAPGYIVSKRDGRPFTRPQLSQYWMQERDRNPRLEPLRAKGLSFHGLRCTAVIRLRRAGVEKPLICDAIGMSARTVDHYCRLSEQRDNAIAAMSRIDAQIIQIRQAKSLK
jgi:integrase